MKRISTFLFTAFEKADLRLMIFVLLCLNFLSFSLSSNEEAYLPLAKQFMNPDWIPNSFTFTEWPGNRLLFQFITGWLLKYLTFEQVAFGGRLLVFLIIAFPVGRLFRKLEIGNLPALLLLQFYLVRQNYFAGEFIFGDFEAKSLAYIMVFAGLNCLFNRKYLFAACWAVPAAYLHILVGGWFFFLVLVFTLFSAQKFSILLKQVLVFSVLIAPFALYLAREVLSSGSVIQGVNIDQVYVFFRNPHHTAPLSVQAHLLRTMLQVAGTAIVFGLTLFVFSKKKGPVFDDLYLLNVIILTVLFISLAISLIDHTGVFLKFYPFRLAALGLLLMYLYVYKLVSVKWQSPALVQLILLSFGLYLLIAASLQTLKGFMHNTSRPSYEALVDFVSSHTDPSDIFLSLGDYDLSFSRRTSREVFVNLKFDPGGGRKIYEWYHRIGERKKLSHNTAYINQIMNNYKLSYLLSDHLLPPCSALKLAFQNADYYLYKIQ
jgi:hypothetical protein